MDLARLEVRNFAYRVFLLFIFDLYWAAFGQTTGAFGQQQPQQQPQQPQQQPAANPMFGGFGTNPSTTQTTGFSTTGRWIRDLVHQLASNSPPIDQGEHSVRHRQTQRACSAPPNPLLVSVRLVHLVQLGLGPRLGQLPRARLANRAQALQEHSETPVFSVINLRSEQVSIFRKILQTCLLTLPQPDNSTALEMSLQEPQTQLMPRSTRRIQPIQTSPWRIRA